MARTTTRFLNLGKAFKYGRSEMYNRVAQICVIYEDLRIETAPLFAAAQNFTPGDEVQNTFEILYYLRRSIASLMEYRGALNQLSADEEFKQRLLLVPEKQRAHITEANVYFEGSQELVKTLRNDIGGHFQIKYARHATANFPSNETGKLEWVSDDATLWSLKIDLAAGIVTSGLEHTLKPESDWRVEFRTMMETIGAAYTHAQSATYSLVASFLWRQG
jgi:hypothetical protein